MFLYKWLHCDLWPFFRWATQGPVGPLVANYIFNFIDLLPFLCSKKCLGGYSRCLVRPSIRPIRGGPLLRYLKSDLETILQKWPPCWDDVSHAKFGSLPWRSRSLRDLSAKSCLAHIVHGPESEIIPPGGIFVDPYIFVVWTLVFKNLVVGCKINARWRHNKLVSLATHAVFNEGPHCNVVSYFGLICI